MTENKKVFRCKNAYNAFILVHKLTFKEDEVLKVWMKVESITSIEESPIIKGSTIHRYGEYFHIKETVEEVLNLMESLGEESNL